MFAYCGNNPILRKDDGGEIWEVALGAAVGGAIAGAIIGAVSHVVSAKINGEDITVSGMLGAVALSALSGAAGAVGGLFGGTVAVAVAATVGVVNGGVTAYKTEGSTKQKVITGLVAGAVSGFGTFLGSKIPVADDGNFAAGVTAFAGGLFIGAPAEIINVTAQNIVTDAVATSSKNSMSMVGWRNQRTVVSIY